LLSGLRTFGQGRSLAELRISAELVLSVGTTLGVAALVLVALPPTWRLHLRFRPGLRFPPGVSRRAGGLALTGSWLLVIVADVVLGELVPSRLVVGALALGNTIGPTVVAIPMVILTRRICGKAAVQGAGHAALAGLLAGAAGAAVGAAISVAVPMHHKLEAFALAVPAAAGAIVAFGTVAYVLDDGDLKAVLAWARRVRKPNL
jgi:putative peptidoglycan lipid II flippase